MEVTAELREKIDKLSPEKRKQFERYVDFLLEEAKLKSMMVDEDSDDSSNI